MERLELLRAVEEEIQRLQQVVKLLRGTATANGRGGKRRLSKDARERIAAAQRARWAKFKKAKKGS